jgi:deazaflavin-dependent oxidoreductase (nitroreductase family)
VITVTAEQAGFRALNAAVEPIAAAGLLGPGCFPGFGVTVLRTVGRRSGQSRSVPLLAVDVPGGLLVSTVRGPRSQWLANLRANPAVTFRWRGRESSAQAHVVAVEDDLRRLPAELAALGSLLAPSIAAGWSFAILHVEPLRDAPTGGQA